MARPTLTTCARTRSVRRLLLSSGTPTGTRTNAAGESQTPISRGGVAKSAALLTTSAPDLAKVVAAWPLIGERGKATILGIAKAASHKAGS